MLARQHGCFGDWTRAPVPPCRSGFLAKRLPTQRRDPMPHDDQSGKAYSADAALGGDLPEQQPEPMEGTVFPRIHERDPYRLLGLEKNATFEEIQDARNYYFEQYRHHERSRDAIEVAFDTLLKEKMRSRQKYGFRPPKTGRRTDMDAEPELPFWQNLFQNIRNTFEPNVPATTIVNDGFIYILLACWAAGTQHAAGDPTAPFVVSLGFCVWRLFDKRQKRNPDGPYFGNSPIWGALGTALLGFVFALVVINVLVPRIPLPAKFATDAFGAFLAAALVGCTSIFVK